MIPGGMPSVSGSSSQEQNAALDSAFSYTSDVIVGGSKSGDGLSMPVILAIVGAALVALILFLKR